VENAQNSDVLLQMGSVVQISPNFQKREDNTTVGYRYLPDDKHLDLQHVILGLEVYDVLTRAKNLCFGLFGG